MRWGWRRGKGWRKGKGRGERMRTRGGEAHMSWWSRQRDFVDGFLADDGEKYSTSGYLHRHICTHTLKYSTQNIQKKQSHPPLLPEPHTYSPFPEKPPATSLRTNTLIQRSSRHKH